MSDATASEHLADLPVEQRRADGHASFEQAIFVHSPFGVWATTLILFALLLGSYAFCQHLSGRDPAALLAGLKSDDRDALALSALMAAALGLQRFNNLRGWHEVPALARVLKGGVAEAIQVVRETPEPRSLLRATLIGLACIAAVGLFLSPQTDYWRGPGLAVRLWFSLLNALVILIFARGLAMTRMAGRTMTRVIDEQLLIDLLRIEDLGVWGRMAGRVALIWFAVCAIVFLIILNEPFSLVTVIELVACAAIGIWVFFARMQHIHRRIGEAKRRELERARLQIDHLRHEIGHSADAAARLQGVIAYEARIAAVREWPFDQTTLMRFAASALVLGVPWFGQAVAQYLVDHLVH